MSDPFDNLDLRAELDPANWTETDRLRTPTLEAILDEEKRLTLVFPDGTTRGLSRSDVEALTRFLIQYANVAPLAPVEDPFAGWTPTRVIGPDGPEHE